MAEGCAPFFVEKEQGAGAKEEKDEYARRLRYGASASVGWGVLVGRDNRNIDAVEADEAAGAQVVETEYVAACRRCGKDDLCPDRGWYDRIDGGHGVAVEVGFEKRTGPAVALVVKADLQRVSWVVNESLG